MKCQGPIDQYLWRRYKSFFDEKESDKDIFRFQLFDIAPVAIACEFDS